MAESIIGVALAIVAAKLLRAPLQSVGQSNTFSVKGVIIHGKTVLLLASYFVLRNDIMVLRTKTYFIDPTAEGYYEDRHSCTIYGNDNVC